MAVIYDAATTSSISDSSLTFSHTTSGSNRVLYVCIAQRVGSAPETTIDSVTYNGVALSNVGEIRSNHGVDKRSYIWRLVNPASGANDVVVTASSSSAFVATAISFTGVDQVDPDDTAVTAEGNNTADVSVTVSSEVGDMVLDSVAWDEPTLTYTVGANQTERGTGSGSSENEGSVSTEAGASSVTMSGTLAGVPAKNWAQAAININQLVPTISVSDSVTVTESVTMQLVSFVTRKRIEIDTSSASSAVSPGSSVTWSHTVSGTERILIVGTATEDATSENLPVTSITYGGVALTQVRGDTLGTQNRNEIWYLLNPSVGTADIVVTWTGANDNIRGLAVSLNGVRGISQPDANNGATGSSATISVNVTTVANDSMVVDMVQGTVSGNAITVGAGQTQLQNVTNTGGFRMGSSYERKGTAGSTTMSWTLSSSGWLTSAMSVAPFDNTSEFLTVSESVNLTLVHGLSVSDSVSVTENRSISSEISLVISDAITVTESASPLVDRFFLSVSDSITVTESVSSLIVSGVSITEKIDQSQTTGSSAAGHGEFAAVRYRGMGFKPVASSISAISFDRNKGTRGIKIYVDTANSSSIPTNTVGSELYSFVILNSTITGAYQTFTLPSILQVTPEAQYTFYIAPWNTGTDAYADDYQDTTWRNSNVYSRGGPIINNAGTWSVADSGNLDMKFDTRYPEEPIFVSESVTVQLVLTPPTLADTVTVAENVSHYIYYPVNVSETVTVTENITLSPQSFISVSDSITVTDYEEEALTHYVSTSDRVWVFESYENAYTFNGTTANINFGSMAAVNALTHDYTILAWIRPTSVSGFQRIFAAPRTTSNNGFAFGLNSTNLRFTTYGIKDYDTSTAPISANRTFHVAARIDSSDDTELFVNGASVQTVTHTAPGVANTDDGWRIGATTPVSSSSLSELFNGEINEVIIYSRSLTDQEIQDRYNGIYDSESGLVFRALFNNDGGSTALDTSGNGYTGTVTAATITPSTKFPNYGRAEINSDISVSETISVAESASAEFTFGVDVSDSVTIEESATQDNSADVSSFDAISVAEGKFVELSINVDTSDLVTLTELISFSQIIVVGEDITVTENSNVAQVSLVSVFDTISVTDTQNVAQVFALTVNDSVTVTENLTVIRFYPVTVNESITVADTLVDTTVAIGWHGRLSINNNIWTNESRPTDIWH